MGRLNGQVGSLNPPMFDLDVLIVFASIVPSPLRFRRHIRAAPPVIGEDAYVPVTAVGGRGVLWQSDWGGGEAAGGDFGCVV